MSFIGIQKPEDARITVVSTKADGALQTAFRLANVANHASACTYYTLTPTSNADSLQVQGTGIIPTSNTSPRTLTISTTSDLRVSQNNALLATNNWTMRASANDQAWWQCVTWSPELRLFAAARVLNSTGFSVMTSPDGLHWTSRATPNDNQYRDICWSPELGLFAAVALTGSLDRIITSSNGVTWTARTTENHQFQGVIWAKELGLFVAVSANGTTGNNQIVTSSNGIVWTARTTPANNQWRGVAWSPELKLLAVVSIDANVVGSQAMTSPDGVNWTIQTTPTNNQWIKIDWSSELGLFAAVSPNGSTDRVMTSPDGVNWNTKTTSASNIGWRDIISVPHFGAGAFVAVGNLPAGSLDRVMISFDGNTWTNQYSPTDANWESVAWSPELGVLVSVASQPVANNKVMTSKTVGVWGAIAKGFTHAQVMSRLSMKF